MGLVEREEVRTSLDFAHRFGSQRRAIILYLQGALPMEDELQVEEFVSPQRMLAISNLPQFFAVRDGRRQA